MTKPLLLLVLAVFSSGGLSAQLDLLTLRESLAILERIPEVSTAKRKGMCPEFSTMPAKADEFSVQARTACGPERGQLIGNYTLNRRTGAVALWGDNPLPVADADLKAFAERLVLEAQNRVLSTTETRCVALEAARSLPGWSGSDASVSVDVRGTSTHESVQFRAERRSSIRPADSGRGLRVDPRTVRVTDDETGQALMSAGLGSLTSKLLALRQPPWLTDEDAISITVVLQIPSFAKQFQAGCRLWAGGAFRSDEAVVGLACGDRQNGGAGTVAVNLKTGGATYTATGEVLDSQDSVRLARDLLDKIKRERLELRKSVETVCRAE